MSAGDVHPAVGGVDELVVVFGADLRAAREASPLPVVGDELARVLAEGLPPAETPVHAPRRRRPRLRSLVAGAAVVGLSTSGLAAAGALPGPVQRRVADVADLVGIDLPRGGTPPTSVPPALPVPSTAPAPVTIVRPAPSSTVPPVLEQDPHDRGRGAERRPETTQERPAAEPRSVPAGQGRPAAAREAPAEGASSEAAPGSEAPAGPEPLERPGTATLGQADLRGAREIPRSGVTRP